MKITTKDYSMSPFLKPDDELEFVPGQPIPNGRICLDTFGSKKRVRQVFKEGEYYRLNPLNYIWVLGVEYVHAEKTETFVITEKCRDWVNERAKLVNTVERKLGASEIS